MTCIGHFLKKNILFEKSFFIFDNGQDAEDLTKSVPEPEENRPDPHSTEQNCTNTYIQQKQLQNFVCVVFDLIEAAV
jgi:hypothetical protein